MRTAAIEMYLNKLACRPCMHFEIIKMKLPVARKLAVGHTSFVCLTASFLATGCFVKIPLFFHDYSGFYKFHAWNLFGFFPGFPDFQSLWEPCIEADMRFWFFTHRQESNAQSHQSLNCNTHKIGKLSLSSS